MTERRIQFNNIIQNQLPAYVREEFPLVAEFLKQYYISQEFQSSPTDIIQNIDQYIKLDSIKKESDYTNLHKKVLFSDEEIFVKSTEGFPKSYGLIQIDDEVITYTETKENKVQGTANISVGSTICYFSGLSEDYVGRQFQFDSVVTNLLGDVVDNIAVVSVASTYFTISSVGIASTSVYGYDSNNTYDFTVLNPSFSGCIRGFSGTISYTNENKPDQLVFKDTESADHSILSSSNEQNKVINLSSLFLKEFFNKIKYQLSPGFENREFYSGLDKYLFLKQSKDFYSTRGTDLSFKILFKVLYGEDVKIIKPKEQLISPSDAQYVITNDLVVESIEGDPYELLNSTLFQDEYQNIISRGYAPIANVEKIYDVLGKSYYKLSFDSGYNRDITFDGSLYGNFSVHQKTKNIGGVEPGANTIDVDSTVGFPNSGELYVTYTDGTSGVISYESKNINQFFGCENISGRILDASDISLNVYARNEDSSIKVRITSVLDKIVITDETFYQEKETKAIIKTLGVTSFDVLSSEWILNNSISFESQKLEQLSPGKYKLTTKTSHNLKVGDNIELKSSDNLIFNGVVSKLNSNLIFEFDTSQSILINRNYTLQRKLLKASSQKYSSILNENTNVQNIYRDKEKVLIASPSLPSYPGQSLEPFNRTLVFSDTFPPVGIASTDTFRIQNHGFYTGESVYYSASSNGGRLFDDGIYFVKEVDSNNLKFAESRTNLYNSIFINLDNPVTVTDSKIEDVDFYNKQLESQKLLREIKSPINDGVEYNTNPGPVGILVNGVEIYSYKSKDKIFYGPIEEISVVNPGSNYDIINPPVLTISDSVGTGATAHCSVKGSLQEIRIIDPGFNYIETPKIIITGGNGKSAKANALMKLIDHQVTFNSEQASQFVNISNDTIGFSTYHKFTDAEKVIYKSEGQQIIGGLVDKSQYYVSVINSTTVRLHSNYQDALSGINTVSLTSFGVGNHILESYNKKSVLSSINIEDPGFDYENKKRTTNFSGISTSNNSIFITNHDFKSGEIVQYSTTGTAVGGLISNENYYVTKIDDNNFRLSLVGVGTDNQDFYYKTEQFIELTSIGTGLHIFNYPQISVQVLGNVGISSINGLEFKAVVQPIFRGQITSVHLENGGVGYGSSEIINFIREPLITLNSGSDCKLVPVINNGSIVDVLIDNPGSGYNSSPRLSIISNSNGVGAILTPILENGQIKRVNIIEGGVGYDPNNTFIVVTSAGSGAEFKFRLKSWTINLFQKYFNGITNDDGFIFNNLLSQYGLQYAHLYAPRKLRENLYSKGSEGNILYGSQDLIKQNNQEISSQNHSPIIGWSYDGYPIYGPYGYSKKDGGSIVQLKSGYVESIQLDRPPFANGFFVEDYEYQYVNDDTVLDEYNGRFCITPDFPNGTYAYFITVGDSPFSNLTSNLNGYKLPVFPYVIGNNFKGVPNAFNYQRTSNQDNIDLNKTDWFRDVTKYNLSTTYKYVSLPNNLNQTIDIQYANPGSIENIGIITGGLNYKVNDKINFESGDSKGFGFASKVSRVGGKQVNSISVATTSINEVLIYPQEGARGSFLVESQTPHNFNNKDIINIVGINTSITSLENSYTIDVTQKTFAVSDPSGIGSIAATGIVTYFSVSKSLRLSEVKENDIYTIGTEKVKVLNVDGPSSKIRVLRGVDGTVGSAHSYTDVLYENPRTFTINVGNTTSFDFKSNKEIYFNPKESLSLGVGIGTTIIFSNPGVGITQVFIPSKSIYIPNHGLETGDMLTYFNNGGSSISVSKDGVSSFSLQNQSNVYVAKISNDLVGISTVKVGLGSTGTFVGIASTTQNESTVYFTGIGTNVYHSFKTNYKVLNAKVTKNIVTVSTAQTHGLLNGDSVFVNVNPGISKTFTVKYNDFNRKVSINSKSFSSGDVDINLNTISILNHNFVNGQKVIYSSSTPSGGLVNNKIYYIVVFDENTVKLSTSYYSATSTLPEIVNITTASSGELLPINPPINAYKDSLLIFDVSDASLSYSNGSLDYSAFDLRFYKDSNYTQIFESSLENPQFEVQRFGRVGIDTGAFISLRINSQIPQKLFYKLDPVNYDSLPIEKKEVKNDDTVNSNNEIIISESLYNGKHQIISTSSTSFTYNLVKIPENSSYTSSSSIISYETNSPGAFGPVTKIEITSKGQNYFDIPYFTDIDSEYGTGAILEANSTSIGKIKKTKINDIGFDYPSDFTLRPSISIPQILKVDPLNSIDSIGIASVGRGYNVAPNLIVFDGKTKQRLPEIDLRYNLGDSKVTILNNTYRLNNVEPIIIPTQNSNGVGISSVSFNNATKDVTVTLSVGFSTINSFPFAVGDRILVENISVGVNSTGTGFNSEDYGYKLFTLKSIDENIGGFGSVTYNLSDVLSGSDFPGTYDDINSSGRIIPEKYFPTFDIVLKQNDFFKNEEVKYSGESDSIGYVENWNRNTKLLKVLSAKTLEVGNFIEGLSSKTNGEVSIVYNFDAFSTLAPYSRVESGWSNEVGYLNDNLQRIQDSFYYQNFSYSLKSKVPYDTWEDPVGSLNHTAGFKKFSDYQLETNDYCGIATDINSRVDVTVDIDGFANLNCVYDFDLASENSLFVGSKTISDEINFSSRILTDYFESVGNRVLSIDDISGEFNSNPRSTKYSVVHKFPLSDARAQKYVTYVRDRRYTQHRQLMLFTLVHDNIIGYLNQYAKVESNYDLGLFDFTIQDSEGLILFYPNRYKINDYDVTTLSYNIKDNFSGIGSTNIGGIVQIDTSTVIVSSGSTTIVGLGSTFTSSKVLVEIVSDNGDYQFDEINLVRDDSNVAIIDYGQLTTKSGLGTYYAYISGTDAKVDFIPSVGIAATASILQVSLGNTSVSGIGTFDLKYVRLEANSTSIASTSSPVQNIISQYPNTYDGGYFMLQISDVTNNRHQFSEVVVVNDNNNVYYTEFGNIETISGIGTVGVAITTNSTQLLFTPIADIDVEVKVYFNSLNILDPTNSITEYNNKTIVSDYGIYYGTERDIRREFELTHKNLPIFKRYFDGSSSSIVSVATSSITIPNHFFVTGEKITYSYDTEFQSGSPIGIGTTDFGIGIGTTDKLPSSVYVIKIDENNIRLARSAGDALKLVPIPLKLTSVGIGSSHSFTSVNQNAKSLVAIDNVIQSPIVSTAITTTLSADLPTSDDVLYCNSITNFYVGEFIKIDDEIMKIESVGIANTNAIRVIRPWMGTNFTDHSIGSTITKLTGNYNIVENKIHFASAPYGNVPLGTSTNSPDERDWEGVSSTSHFQGRTFMRSGVTDSSNESYYKNYIFDDISSGFTGIAKTFALLSGGSNISENISTQNGVILINDIFQNPGLQNNYILTESSGVNYLNFVGTATSLASDINTSNLPSGGIIVSIGSTEGFGYQPLIGAGGTAVVSIAGTISSISIGNSGSGYRNIIQTLSGIKSIVTRVGVTTSTTGTPSIEFIGTAVVSNGSIVSIAITNPGIGYTSTNPPYVIIDEPISYSDIPLIYSSTSSGIGTQASIDVVVGQGSSIISFEIKNLGYGYEPGDVLTLPIGGAVGIPTISTSSFNEFQVTVERIFNDKFSGWTFGELVSFDNIERYFNGTRNVFPLIYQGQLTSIYAKKGSPINVQDTLLVFVNDILQVPGEGYIFNGGSKIQFTEPLKQGDNCKILFYKGSGDGVDVIFRDIIEPIKIGDNLILGYDSYRGQPSYLQEDSRTVQDILSLDSVETNSYFGPGNTNNPSLLRPITLCRQTEDKIVNDVGIAKTRTLYEPLIYPTTYLIQPVGIGSTILNVESIRPFFNPLNENNVSLDFQNKITIISQEPKVSASATAIVSTAGTISSINIENGGFGYTEAPAVIIQNPVGIETTSPTTTSFITSGIVTSIAVSGLVTGYSQSNPPIVLVESPSLQLEENAVRSFSGDFGFISGISTISVGVASTGLVFDFTIPSDSYLRDNSITGFTTVSGIQTGYYFVISNSNIGNGVTSLDVNGSIVGVSTNFLDGVYQAVSVSIAQTSVVGLGLTYVAKVTVSLEGYNGLSGIGYSNYYGNYSWGRIVLKSRSKENQFNSYTDNGYAGISTGGIVRRTVPLKYFNYIS